VYQEISGDISWSTVNGYYGLAKDAYPSLNPLSSGAKAVQTWTQRTVQEANGWRNVCWSPQLGIFVAVADNGTNQVMTSSNGINWTPRTALAQACEWRGVCWSPELRLFVATNNGSGSNKVMTSPDGITWTGRTASEENAWGSSACWSPELGLFLAVSRNGNSRVMTSRDGTTWIPQSQGVPLNGWHAVCWSPELRLFVAVAYDGNNRVMTSPNGTTWTPQSQGIEANQWNNICWSPKLGIFVAVSWSGTNCIMTSPNGINWTARLPPTSSLSGICWSAELGLFVAIGESGAKVMSSPDGINWTARSNAVNLGISVCWSPELGIFVGLAYGANIVLTSSLKGRPPTSYNVFDSSFNSIDQFGKWTFQTMYTPTMTVQTANVNSDDRLKHNEVVIVNGLDVIDKLNPKFYQKTLTLLDASYNGDLSGHIWSYEAGLIAQEVLQIPDLSFAVSGGDYYQESYILKNQSNDPSTNYININSTNYDPSTNYINSSNYDISANYDISYNLIKQPYALNYNSVFTYGIAAIKELHAKVKIQETTSLDEQLNSLIERIEALEHVSS
jgi:hypothetical protein